MFQGIAFEKLTHVIELGAGTGCFTQELYDNVPEGCSVMVIELNPDYIPPLKEKYGHRFEIIQGSAADVDVLLEKRGWSQVDLIVSGLPFTLPVEVMHPLMKTLQKFHGSPVELCRNFLLCRAIHLTMKSMRCHHKEESFGHFQDALGREGSKRQEQHGAKYSQKPSQNLSREPIGPPGNAPA